jgi:hypothetical protein
MTRTTIAIIALLLGSLPAEAQVIHLLCDGTAKIPGIDPWHDKSWKLVVNLDDRTVAFSGLTARIEKIRIEKIDNDYVTFGQRDSSRSTAGYINRLTGAARVGIRTFDPDTLVEWELTCRTARPLF